MDLVAYIDESGTHNNRYLVISALVIKDAQVRKKLKRIVKRCYVKYSDKCKVCELHAYQLNFAEKQHCARAVAKLKEYEIFYLVADKENINERDLLRRPNLFYNYLFSHLSKKIVARYPDKKLHFICDNREVSAQSKNSLPEYIQTGAYADWGFTGELTIEFMDSRDAIGLQAVDLIANATYAKYNLNKEHIYGIYINGASSVKRVKFPCKYFGAYIPRMMVCVTINLRKSCMAS